MRSPVATSPYNSTSWSQQLHALASRVAMNRTVAGVHFPIDSVAGAILGLTLGRYLVKRCTNAASYEAWSFDSANFIANADFQWFDLYDVATSAQKEAVGSGGAKYAVQQNAAVALSALDRSLILEQLWTKARAEWP